MYEYLLKLIDPYNYSVNAPSRYYDKALTAHTIFITSPFSPKELYNEMTRGRKKADGFDQFQRRLTKVIHMTEDSIYDTLFNQEKGSRSQQFRIPNQKRGYD